MSKASEWARIAGEPPAGFVYLPADAGAPSVRANVVTGGDCGIVLSRAAISRNFEIGFIPGEAMVLLSPRVAASLARWILETFGEEE